MDTLKDKIILITGAGKGSGRILAQAFAEQGAILALNDISRVNVEEVVDQIVAKGGRAKAYIDDIAKKVAVQNIINLITKFTSVDTVQRKSAFIASMHGLDGFTRQAARELSPYEIQVYAIENVQGKIVEMILALLDLKMEER